MNVITNNNVENVVQFIGTVERGIFPEADPSRELYKITSTDGNIYYAVTEGFVNHTVDTIPAGVEPDKWCYTDDDGFYLNPDWSEFNRYGQEYKEGYEQVLLDLMEGK